MLGKNPMVFSVTWDDVWQNQYTNFWQHFQVRLVLSMLTFQIMLSQHNINLSCCVTRQVWTLQKHSTAWTMNGNRGKDLYMFRSYHVDMKQFATINRYISEFSSIKSDDPRGSTLGDLLFHININDFPKLSIFSSWFLLQITILWVTASAASQLTILLVMFEKR